jgi:methionyl aminopeptidase
MGLILIICLGYLISPYCLHSGKLIPFIKGGPQTKMGENEIYAIQVFGSTGKGQANEDGECSYYMKDFEAHTAKFNGGIR